MGGLRTSEDAVVVAGEGTQGRVAEDRSIDRGPTIVLGGEPTSRRPVPPPPTAPAPVAAAEPRAGGLWVVIVAYILASAALAAAIYERYVM